MIDAEEVQATDRSGSAAEQCRVGIKVAEVVDGSLLHGFQQARVILIGRSCAQLIPTVTHTPSEIRNHCSHVMRNDLERGPAVEKAGEDHSRHCHAGFVWLAKRPEDLELRAVLCLVVRKVRMPVRM